MDFWAWWASVEPRTDWIAIVVGFFATLASTFIAVLIALRLQRKDFEKRAKEAAEQNAADAEQRRLDLETRKKELAEQSDADARSRRDDWRRTIVAKAFDVLNDAEGFAMDPSSSNGNQRSASIDALMMEFRLDAEPGGDYVGQWFRRVAYELANSEPGDHPGLQARARFELTEWAIGKNASDRFSSM